MLPSVIINPGVPQVVRLLMTLVHGDGKQRRPSANRKDGGLLVLLCTESHPSEKLTCTSMACFSVLL